MGSSLGRYKDYSRGRKQQGVAVLQHSHQVDSAVVTVSPPLNEMRYNV